MDIPFLHVFPYSPRPGTPAARMPAVAKAIRKDRAAALREVGATARRRFFDGLVGTTTVVLAETETAGHSEHFAPVVIEAGTTPVVPGRLLQARITATTDDHLIAEPA